MKIRVPGYALFFILVLLLYTVITHARGVPPHSPYASVDFDLPEGSIPVDPKKVQKFLALTVGYSRYHYPWFIQPRVYTAPASWFINYHCGGVECGIMGSTRMQGEPIIFLRAGMEQDQFEEFMVHELTHWLQAKSGWLAVDCKNYAAQEIEAYTVQNMFRTITQQRWTKFWTPEYICVPMINRGHH